MGVETIKEPTLSWADIAVSGNRRPNSDGGVKDEADQQSLQTSNGDEHRAEDEEAMKEDKTNSTGVASEQNEEPERDAVGGSDVRKKNAKAPCVDGRPGVEDSMDCGEEILGDTNATVERNLY